MVSYDALELELRQLPGVSFVALADREGTTFIELLARAGSVVEIIYHTLDLVAARYRLLD